MSKYIDKIIYINLEKRPDRKMQIEVELDNFGLSYERFNAIETEDGCIGCAISHLQVLKLAKERGYKNVLILEDDFTFLVSKEVFEYEINLFFEKYENNYDVCMISYLVIQHEIITEQSNMNKILEAQTTSGYIVNAAYFDKLIELYEESNRLLEQTRMHWIYANDQIWKKYQPIDNWYYFKTRLGKQRAGYSDLFNQYVDYGA